jgi:cytochrome aa3-600 menaquinol oxidase subunit 1
MSVFFFISGFGLVFEWFWMGIAGALGVLVILILRSLEKDKGYYVSVEEIQEHQSQNKLLR